MNVFGHNTTQASGSTRLHWNNNGRDPSGAYIMLLGEAQLIWSLDNKMKIDWMNDAWINEETETDCPVKVL